jgi:hypothetical protein
MDMDKDVLRPFAVGKDAIQAAKPISQAKGRRPFRRRRSALRLCASPSHEHEHEFSNMISISLIASRVARRNVDFVYAVLFESQKEEEAPARRIVKFRVARFVYWDWDPLQTLTLGTRGNC